MVTIIERDNKGDTVAYDIYSRLLKDRVIFLGEEITPAVASTTIAQFLFLSKTSKKPIDFYIMCAGGEVESGLAIYDTMQYIENDVSTFCIGEASSMAAILLAAGTAGKRYALPHSKVMLHQPWGGMPASDVSNIEIYATEMTKTRKELYDILAKHTGQDAGRIAKDCDRDFYMTAKEAMEYGVLDDILAGPVKRRKE